MADVIAPYNKYLKPASVERSSVSMKPASTYSGMEVVSMARYSRIKSDAEAIKHIPIVEASSST